jgi:hypothetical protein
METLPVEDVAELAELKELAPFMEWMEKFWWIFLLLIVWALAWKGVALWRAARNGSKPWFIVLLLVNTLGILEIIYVLGFSTKPTTK